MDRKEENKAYKDKDEERYKEKVVYKIIPVPYYYPVPVDAEWYHKNYERHYRPAELTGFPFVDTTVDHLVPPPPPGFPFPRFRHPHHHFIYEPSSKRVSPPPPPTSNHQQQQQQSTSSPKRVVENGREDEIPHVAKPVKCHNQNGKDIESVVNAIKPTIGKTPVKTPRKTPSPPSNRSKELKSTVTSDEIIIKTEAVDADIIVFNGENSPKEVVPEDYGVEAIRDRKRYLMTFPYDQKKKVKVNGHGEDHEPVKNVVYEKVEAAPENVEIKEKEIIHTEVHEPHCPTFPAHGIRYPAIHPAAVPVTHQPVIPQGVPYVMVPMQNPAFMHPKIVHQPHFPAEHRRHPLEDVNHSPDAHDNTASLDDRGLERGQSEDEQATEVKYHPNGRRARTVFTRQQLLTLNNVFEKHHFVSGERMSELSDQLGLDRKIVKIWFQNKRQYSRKKGSLLEREDEYFQYEDAYNSGSAPPSMTMVNQSDMNFSIHDEYKDEDYLKKELCDENVTYKINDEKIYEVPSETA